MRLFLRLGALSIAAFSFTATAKDNAFKIGKKTVSMDQLLKDNAAQFYEIEKKKYETLEQIARQAYIEDFWKQEAKKRKTTTEKAEAAYMKENSKVSDKEFNDAYNRFKNDQQLKDMPEKKKKTEIRTFLERRKQQEVVSKIVSQGQRSGAFKILAKKPKEPLYPIKVDAKTDVIRYQAGNKPTVPAGCTNDCKITVVEYSEFECPFCSRIIPTAEKLLKNYKGKMRWVVRDFPLAFHARAEPASTAAHCANLQNKYWEMYHELFKNQRKLADKDLMSYAKNMKGLNYKKWESCYKNPPSSVKTKIAMNKASGSKFGVTGTPAFFINGRKLSGALPYNEFDRIFKEELASK